MEKRLIKINKPKLLTLHQNSDRKIMNVKSLCFLLLITVTGLNVSAQNGNDVLLTVGDIKVTVDEFKYIYEKNNGKDANYSEASLKEYLDLYAKFKLKVNEAKFQKIDTIQALKEELSGYKRQLTNSFLMDKGVKQFLLEDLKKRVTKDIRIAHIYIPVQAFATDSIKQAAEEKIQKAWQLLKTKDFAAVANEYSEDKNSKDMAGDIGYYTAMMPSGFYHFENAMYQTPVNTYSKPLKSKLGWHILKVTDIREARGQISVSHIYIKKADNPNAKLSIDAAYKALKSQMTWNEAVSKYSQDTETAANEGNLPVFGINNYERSFEDAAFSLQNPGDISQPFETSSGWHIVRLNQKYPVVIDENFNRMYEPKIKSDERWQTAREDYLRSVKEASNFKINNPLLEKFSRSLSEDFFTYRWTPSKETSDEETLVSFGTEVTGSLGEFKRFAQQNSRIRLRYDKINHTPSQALEAVMQAYTEEKTLEFEQKTMEAKYPDFKALLREYEEGILLFEVTKNEVWDKANQDSTGLVQYYNANKSKYMSEEKALVNQLLIKNTDEKTATKIMMEVAKSSVNSVLKKYNKKETIIEVSNLTLTKSDAEKLGLDWKIGSINAMEKNPSINAYVISKLDSFIAPAPKELKETRGYVVADFQDNLEKQWIENLQKKYPSSINYTVLKQLIK